MQRRDFLKAAVVGAAAAPWAAAKDQGESPEAEYYEYRRYHLSPMGDAPLLETYLREAFIPAVRRRGGGPVGVFRPLGAATDAIHVMTAFPSLASFAAVAAGVDGDPEVRAAVPDYFTAATKARPAYDRMDSTLLRAMPGQPKLVPPPWGPGRSRLFELREYESFSEDRNLAKVAMFDSGEMQVQRDVGLAPVLYGQALSGPRLPRVIYLLAGPDPESHRQHWAAFRKHPTWLKMKADPRYADTATHNTSTMLDPLAFSEL